MGSEPDKEFRWRVILEEWGWEMKNEDHDHMFFLMERIMELRSMIAWVQNTCYAISVCHVMRKELDGELVMRLNELYPYDYTDPKNVQLALTNLGTREYDLEILQDEYKRLQAENEPKDFKRPTEKEFLKQVQSVAKWFGSAIDEKVTTVLKYTATYQLCLEEIKRK